MVIDVVGYFSTDGGAVFTPIDPARVLDSRAGAQVGPFSTPWGQGTIRDVSIAGVGGVPTAASAVISNVTVTNTTAPSFLSVWPTGLPTPDPLVSSLNWKPGLTIPNAVTAKTGDAGRVRVYNLVGNVDVVIDVVGYYS